jgi:hypothetical protein
MQTFFIFIIIYYFCCYWVYTKSYKNLLLDLGSKTMIGEARKTAEIVKALFK